MKLPVQVLTSRRSKLVTVVWLCLSALVATTCAFSFLQPTWFIKDEPLELTLASFSFGMFSFCMKDIQHTDFMCHIYGGFFDFKNFPSGAWQAACVLFGGGCVFQCLSALLAFLSVCLPYRFGKRLAYCTGHVQTITVIILIVGLLLYPLGLCSPFVRHHCGPTADIYYSGSCRVGWGFMLAIMGTALTIFCPFLVKYTVIKVYEAEYWTQV